MKMIKRKKTIWIAAAAASVVMVFAGWSVYCGFDAWAGLIAGRGIAGVRVRDVLWNADGETHRVRAYRSLGNANVVFLVGVPSPLAGREKCNLLVAENHVAKFNDGGRSFVTTPLYAIAGETVGDPYYLDDEMKGWGAKYRIVRDKDDLVLEIFLAPPHHVRNMTCRIRAKYLERQPKQPVR